MQKLNSLTIFFPFYNDAGTVEQQVHNAYKVGATLAHELEVIAIHGGRSTDNTLEKIIEMQVIYPKLKIIDKTDNKEGYAVIKHGLTNATHEWVFYTDGDAQYNLVEDLEKLVSKHFETKADIINGYKTGRQDGILRVILGKGYQIISKTLFKLPIVDVDCDFRLMKKELLDKIVLESTDASVLPELIKKLELVGAKFAQTPVGHYRRTYGHSSYTPLSLLKEKVIGDIKLYLKMKKYKPQ